jgi:CRISPR-associated exonuclease Cas4
VKIGKALHEERDKKENTEIALENIRLDKLSSEYLTEVKKSDADVEAAKWQLLFYLKILKEKGVIRKGKLEFIEKGKTDKKILYYELTDELEKELESYVSSIEILLESDEIPEVLNTSQCKKCAYYEYCYI